MSKTSKDDGGGVSKIERAVRRAYKWGQNPRTARAGDLTWLGGIVRVSFRTRSGPEPRVLLPNGVDPLAAIGELPRELHQVYATATLGGFPISTVNTAAPLYVERTGGAVVVTPDRVEGARLVPMDEEEAIAACKPDLVIRLRESWAVRCEIAERVTSAVMTVLMCEMSPRFGGRWALANLVERLASEIDSSTLLWVLSHLVATGIVVCHGTDPETGPEIEFDERREIFGLPPKGAWFAPNLNHEAVTRMEIAIDVARQQLDARARALRPPRGKPRRRR